MLSLTTILNEPTTTQCGTRPRLNKNALSFILCGSPSLESPRDREVDTAVLLSPVTKRRRLPISTSSRAGALFLRPTNAKTDTPAAKKSSKLCMIEGCTSRAKHARKCWRHGGSVKCKIPECTNRAKSKGVCWSHGGGTFCSHPDCATIAVSHGFCWAHGGGKRCQIDGCSRPAYERTDNLCSTHHKQRTRQAPTNAASV